MVVDCVAGLGSEMNFAAIEWVVLCWQAHGDFLPSPQGG